LHALCVGAAGARAVGVFAAALRTVGGVLWVGEAVAHRALHFVGARVADCGAVGVGGGAGLQRADSVGSAVFGAVGVHRQVEAGGGALAVGGAGAVLVYRRAARQALAVGGAGGRLPRLK